MDASDAGDLPRKVNNLSRKVNNLSLTQDGAEPSAVAKLPEDSQIPTTERYGNLWSLYRTLDPDTVAPLERAILYCRVRGYEQAEAILNAFPPQIKHHPIIVFEHSQNHWLSWRLRESLNILREAAAWTEVHGEVKDASEIYTLLRISLARVEVLVDTDFTNARESLREIKRWLLNTPIEEYTDIKVGCRVHVC